MIPCPSCDRTWAGEVSLASHLITAHGLGATDAVERARQAMQESEKQTRRVSKKGRGRAMAKNTDRTGECSECHGLRHQKGCSQHFRKKKMAESPKVATKRKAITRRHPKAPKKGKSVGTTDLEIPALATVIEALYPLDLEERRRVLSYVCARFDIDPAKLAA